MKVLGKWPDTEDRMEFDLLLFAVQENEKHKPAEIMISAKNYTKLFGI
jgi:hypothetical protein